MEQSAPAPVAGNDSPGVESRPASPATNSHTGQPANGAPAGQPPPQQPGSFFSSPFIWILLLVFVAINLFGSRGRKKQQVKMERLKTLAKGDRVLTIGRMHGTVVALTDDTMTLKPDDHSGHTMVFDRQALYEIFPRPGEAAEGEAKGNDKEDKEKDGK